MVRTLEAQEETRARTTSEGVLVLVVAPIALLAVGALVGAASYQTKRWSPS